MEPILLIVLPIFAIVATGYAAGRFRLLGEASSEALNRFVYWIALPALLFRAMATVEIDPSAAGRFLAAYTLAAALVWAWGLAVARFGFGCGLAEGTMHAFNSCYANVGYMGIPLVAAAWGPPAAAPVILAALVTVGPLLGVAAATIAAGRTPGGLPAVVGAVLRAIFTNPMVVAPLLGLAWGGAGLELHPAADNYLAILAAAAGPCALVAIGLFLVGKPLREGLGEVTAMTAAKLVLHPLVMALVALWIVPLSPLETKVAILLAALPTGAGSLVLAQATGVSVQRTSSMILIGTVASVATISAVFLVFPPGF